MVNDSILQCENVILYYPLTLLESIFSLLLPGSNLYLFTNFHACILETQVCGKQPHLLMWECHGLRSTHIVRVFLLSLLPANSLYLFTSFHAWILKTLVFGKWPHFTMWDCHPLLCTHIVRVYFFVAFAWQQIVSVYQFSCMYLRNPGLC